MRLDLPHLRSIESAVAGDFDAVVGRGLAGGSPQVVRGLEITGVAAGAPVSGLALVVADALVYNLLASESGSFLWVSESQAPEVLNPLTNGTVTGSWTSGAVNYVGIDFSRAADSDTTDLVQFLDANSLLEVAKSVPLAKTLKYVIQISTLPFSSNSSLIPIAKVTVDSTGLLSDITDSRPMLFRLGSGGDVPDIQNFYGWSGGRAESTSTTSSAAFLGGDKVFRSQKDWQDGVMTRIWELGGGEYWYSASADRNVTLIWSGAPFAGGEHFEWSGTNLHWKGLRFLFDNSTGFYNVVSDQTVDSAGLTNLADGECIYVDLNRGSNATVAAAKAVLTTLGPGALPGSRWVVAWRRGTEIFIRGWRFPVGTLFTPATESAQGVVKISRLYDGTATAGLSGLGNPIAISDRGGIITVAVGANQTGLVITADGGGAGIDAFGGGTSGIGLVGTGGAPNGKGVEGIGTGSGTAGYFHNSSSGIGVHGAGAGASQGGYFTAGSNTSVANVYDGAGVRAVGASGTRGGHGVVALGVSGSNPEPRSGFYGIGGTDGNGAYLIGTGIGIGAQSVGGVTGHAGTWATQTQGAGAVGTSAAGSGVGGWFRGGTSLQGYWTSDEVEPPGNTALNAVGAMGIAADDSFGVVGISGYSSSANGGGGFFKGMDGYHDAGDPIGHPGKTGLQVRGGKGHSARNSGAKNNGGSGAKGIDAIGGRGDIGSSIAELPGGDGGYGGHAINAVGGNGGVGGAGHALSVFPFTDQNGGDAKAPGYGAYCQGGAGALGGAKSGGAASDGAPSWGGSGIYGLGGAGVAGAQGGAGGEFVGGAAGGGAAGWGVLATNGAGAAATAVRAVGYVEVASTNPASTAGFSNTVTNKNFCKAWANFSLNNSVSPTLNDGFNLNAGNPVAATAGPNLITVSFNSNMGTNYTVSIAMDDTMTTALHHCRVVATNAGSVTIRLRDNAGADIDPTGAPVSGLKIMVSVLGPNA